MSNSVIQITDQNLKDILEKNKYVIIKFGANWCNPCHIMKPIIEELANDYIGEIIIGDVDIEINPKITLEYKIKTIPTIFFFKEGNVFDKHSGAAPKSFLKEKLIFLLK